YRNLALAGPRVRYLRDSAGELNPRARQSTALEAERRRGYGGSPGPAPLKIAQRRAFRIWSAVGEGTLSQISDRGRVIYLVRGAFRGDLCESRYVRPRRQTGSRNRRAGAGRCSRRVPTATTWRPGSLVVQGHRRPHRWWR